MMAAARRRSFACVAAAALTMLSLITSVEPLLNLPSYSLAALKRLELEAHNDPDSVAATAGNDSASLGRHRRRRHFLASVLTTATIASTTTAASLLSHPSCSIAAPPIAVIAEELGYFPVTNKQGETVYIGKRVKRESSQQAIQLAQHLANIGVTMFGAYWCPHCARQKELFGKEAWSLIPYVECASKGYGAQPNLCRKVDGFPMWSFPKRQAQASKSANGGRAGDSVSISGEVPLSVLAEASKFTGFRSELEDNLPPPVGGSACK